MDKKERLDLIRRGTVEILTDADLEKLLDEKKQISAYIGRATTGPLHLGHLIAISKVLDLQKAGVTVKILLADIHAALDDLKSRWEDLSRRAEYTRKCIELAFDWQKKPIFVRGSDFETSREYSMDILKMSTISTVDRAMRAASEVTRMKNPKVSELIYPIMQSLDEEYLGVDIQLGGRDQRHIFTFAREYLPELGYRKRVEIMTPLVASLQGPGSKMSSSMPESHIKVYDSEESIRRKIARAYCPEGVVEENSILQMAQFLVFPVQSSMTIERQEKFGGRLVLNSYAELEAVFREKKLHPADLKASIADILIKRLKPAHEYFDKNKDILRELGSEFLP